MLGIACPVCGLEFVTELSRPPAMVGVACPVCGFESVTDLSRAPARRGVAGLVGGGDGRVPAGLRGRGQLRRLLPGQSERPGLTAVSSDPCLAHTVGVCFSNEPAFQCLLFCSKVNSITVRNTWTLA